MSTSLTSQSTEFHRSVARADLLKVISLLDQALEIFKAYDGGHSSALDIQARSMVAAVRDELMAEIIAGE